MKQEVKQAIAILNHKADRLSRVMAGVLQSGMTEQQVFRKYVTGVAQANRDEAAFFAARDAARFAAGHMGLEELMPDVCPTSITGFEAGRAWNHPEEAGTVALSRKDYNRLLKRIDRLEQCTGLTPKPATPKPEAMPEGIDMADMMKQSEACAYLSCGKSTIKQWVAKGLVHAYRQGRYVYYSQKELNEKKKPGSQKEPGSKKEPNGKPAIHSKEE